MFAIQPAKGRQKVLSFANLLRDTTSQLEPSFPRPRKPANVYVLSRAEEQSLSGRGAFNLRIQYIL